MKNILPSSLDDSLWENIKTKIKDKIGDFPESQLYQIKDLLESKIVFLNAFTFDPLESDDLAKNLIISAVKCNLFRIMKLKIVLNYNEKFI